MYDYKRKKLNMKRDFEFMLSKTLSMFRYEGLPETMPHRDFERQLQTKGYAFVTEFKGDLYSFTDGLGGEPDAYGNPTEIVIANPALGFNKTLNLKEDGVLIRNDSMMAGIRNLMREHIYILNENKISMIMNSFNSRIPTLISAGDDATRESAEEYLRQIVKGELGIIAENRLFEGINAQANTGAGSIFTQLIEYNQFIEASLYNELGLEMNNNMKRERLTEDEVNMVDTIYPFVDNMMMNRADGIEEVNKKYGKNIEIEFDSIWADHNEQTDEEFLAEVEMHLGEMMPAQQPDTGLESIFGGTSDEELEQVLAQLLELDEEVLEDGDNSGGGDDGDTDSTTGVEPDGEEQSEGTTSGEDSGSSGSSRDDGDEPGDDNTEPDSESSERDSTASTGERDSESSERDGGESEPGDESSRSDKSDDAGPDVDNTEPDNGAGGRSEGDTSEESGEVADTETSDTDKSKASSTASDGEGGSSERDGGNNSTTVSTTVSTEGDSGREASEGDGTGHSEQAEGSESVSSSEETESGRHDVKVEVEVNIEEEEEEDEG